jgi:hypothetical protein
LRVFELGLSLASALAPLRQGPLVRLIRTRSMIDESLEAVLACLYIGLAAEAGQKLSSAANLESHAHLGDFHARRSSCGATG